MFWLNTRRGGGRPHCVRLRLVVVIRSVWVFAQRAFRNDYCHITRTTSTAQCSKKTMPAPICVETIANSAGGTAQVAIVAQPSIGFLNTKYYSNGSPHRRLHWPNHCRTYPLKIPHGIFVFVFLCCVVFASGSLCFGFCSLMT